MAMTGSLWCWFLLEPKTAHRLRLGSTDKDRDVCLCLLFFFSWISKQLLGFVDVEQEIIFRASLALSLLWVTIVWNLTIAGAFYNCFHVWLPKTGETNGHPIKKRANILKYFWFSWSFNCTITGVPLIIFALDKHGGRFSDLILR